MSGYKRTPAHPVVSSGLSFTPISRGPKGEGDGGLWPDSAVSSIRGPRKLSGDKLPSVSSDTMGEIDPKLPKREAAPLYSKLEKAEYGRANLDKLRASNLNGVDQRALRLEISLKKPDRIIDRLCSNRCIICH